MPPVPNGRQPLETNPYADAKSCPGANGRADFWNYLGCGMFLLLASMAFSISCWAYYGFSR